MKNFPSTSMASRWIANLGLYLAAGTMVPFGSQRIDKAHFGPFSVPLVAHNSYPDVRLEASQHINVVARYWGKFESPFAGQFRIDGQASWPMSGKSGDLSPLLQSSIQGLAVGDDPVRSNPFSTLFLS